MQRQTQDNEDIGAENLAKILASIVGAENLIRDEDARQLYSEDIWQPANAIFSMIVRPNNVDQLVAAAEAIHKAGFAVCPRGAGMSYTAAYLPETARSIAIDTKKMDKILRISREDMTVTVEAGVTWKALHEALAPLGLRTPFWGPMSGLVSTIGGGISQLNAMFGAARYGTSSESVVAMTVLTSDGQILRTGARGPDGNTPHYRHFGPDLAGLFCGDCGTLGIKAEITLRLMALPEFEECRSYSFPSGEALLEAMAEMARQGVAAETCAFDPGLTMIRLQRASLTEDLKTLGAVVAKEKSFGKGLLAAAKIAMGGRNFIAPTDYPLHVMCEGRSKAAVDADVATAHEIAMDFGGSEIENSIAKVIRATPFPALNSILGPTGEAWVPIHGVCSLSNAPKIFTEIQVLYASYKNKMDQQGIQTGFLFTNMSSNGLIIEPVYFWPQGWRAVHELAVEPSHLARLQQRDEGKEARALVVELRKAVIAIFARYGCGHFQIGRTYPYRESRDDISLKLLEAVKQIMDPSRTLNPAILGFSVEENA